MDCITCNLEINNENYILCSCNKYNFKFLYKAKIMKTNWSNKSPQKYAIQLFILHLNPSAVTLYAAHVIRELLFVYIKIKTSLIDGEIFTVYIE